MRLSFRCAAGTKYLRSKHRKHGGITAHIFQVTNKWVRNSCPSFWFSRHFITSIISAKIPFAGKDEINFLKKSVLIKIVDRLIYVLSIFGWSIGRVISRRPAKFFVCSPLNPGNLYSWIKASPAISSWNMMSWSIRVSWIMAQSLLHLSSGTSLENINNHWIFYDCSTKRFSSNFSLAAPKESPPSPMP